jgi:hypothetical protein
MGHEPHEPHEQGLLHAPEHRAQVLNYLRAIRLGLLVNFASAPKARIERLVA